MPARHSLAALFRFAGLTGALGLALLAPGAHAMMPAAGGAMPPDGLTDRMIVRYRNATSAATVTDSTLVAARVAGNRQGVRISHLKATADGAHVLKLDRAMRESEVRTMAQQLKAADANVDYAEPDRLMKIQLVPTDTGYASQWHYKAPGAEPGGLNLPLAWDLSTGAGIVVAVIDTGYRPHADLAANIVAGHDFISTTSVANDGDGRDASALDPGDAAAAGACYSGSPASTSSWHGTHVAGTIAAVTNNGSGVAGVAHGAKVQPVRVLGVCGGYTSDIAAGITWASGGTVSGVAANPTPARVINLSLGGSGACDTTTQNAIAGARARGAVVVVAAGNSNVNASNASPANCSGVVAVAAVDRAGAKAYYSNFGTVVDVAAPGGDTRSGAANGIYSTLNAGAGAPGADSYAYYQGTSMATPHVAGVAALMLARNPALTPDLVEARLKSSARAFPATCSACGAGLVDALAAVTAAGGGATTPLPTPTAVSETAAANNTLATAQAITPALARVSGSISSGSDTDYYRVTLAAGKTLRAILTGPAGADFDLYAYNATGSRIGVSAKRGSASELLTITGSATAATTLYLRVWRYGGTGAYLLDLSQ